jgi:hypothetical protein
MTLCPFDRCKDLSVSALVKKKSNVFEFSYLLEGDVADILIPPASPPMRTDGLWQSTCFEAFIGIGETSYLELNFATSRQWAAYSFANYREGMRQLDIPPPEICFAENRLVATVELAAKSGSPLNVTAVIERKDEGRSYWAIAHPKGNRPDFHARDCFVARLP